LDDGEREIILRRARRLARESGCWESEIARRIAGRLNRSPLTILHTLRQHDQVHPRDAILAWAPIPVPPEDSSRVLRAYRHGVSINALAKKYDQSRTAIYRVIIDERIARLNRRKGKFIDDPLYHEPNAAEIIEQIVQQEPIAAASGRSVRPIRPCSRTWSVTWSSSSSRRFTTPL